VFVVVCGGFERRGFRFMVGFNNDNLSFPSLLFSIFPYWGGSSNGHKCGHLK